MTICTSKSFSHKLVIGDTKYELIEDTDSFTDFFREHFYKLVSDNSSNDFHNKNNI